MLAMKSQYLHCFGFVLTRSFLVLLIVLISTEISNAVLNPTTFDNNNPVQVKDPHQPRYHFQPHHWVNDPNAPMYYNGFYHLFYQYNPKVAKWENIVWGHSVSKDLVNWKILETAMVPSKPFDMNGVWSGSATMLLNKTPVIIYTGINKNQTQFQNYAIPANLSDPYLRKWVKPDDNPIIVPDWTVNGSMFRDPSTAWHSKDGYWRLVVGSIKRQRGMAYLYKSKDFKKWVKAKHPLHSKAGMHMWECLDFFPVKLSGKFGLEPGYEGENIKHVLKVSIDKTRFDGYTIGTFNRNIDRYIPDNTSVDGWDGLRMDYGNYYASKSFFDYKTNRRIFWAWSNESYTPTDDYVKDWAGIQTIPRTVLLDPNGRQLKFWPIEEIEKLRKDYTQINNRKLELQQRIKVTGITAAQADVDVTFFIPNLQQAELFNTNWTNAQDLCGIKGSKVQGGVGPFGLLTLATDDLQEFTPIFFRIFKALDKHVVLMCSDASSSSLKKNGIYKPSFAAFVDVDLSDKKLSLRSLIDHSVVESFGARGKVCITSRVYPTKAVFENAHLFVFNNGTQPIIVESLNAWSMNNPNEMN